MVEAAWTMTYRGSLIEYTSSLIELSELTRAFSRRPLWSRSAIDPNRPGAGISGTKVCMRISDHNASGTDSGQKLLLLIGLGSRYPVLFRAR